MAAQAKRDLGESLMKAAEAADRQTGRRVAGQDPAKQKQILDGAKRVFLTVGFDAASMNDITREAGVSKGTIYVYFENKEELFGALIDRERTALFASLAAALEDGGPMEVALRRYGRLLAEKLTSLQVIRAQRMVLGVVDRMPALGAKFFDSGPDSGKEILKRYMREQVAAGTLKIDDIDLATAQFFDLSMSGLFRACMFGVRDIPPSSADIDRTVESGISMFLKFYGTGK